jgi:hypothetical protein
MLKRLGAPFALTGAFLLISGASFADGDPAVREKNAIDAMQSANAMSVRDGKYVQVRDLLLKGNGSIKAKTEAWETGTQQWMAGWMGILGLMDLKDDVPYSQFESTLTDLLNKQATQIVTLTTTAAAVQKQGTEALALLGNVPGPASNTYPNVDNYKQVIDGLGTREVDLKSAITDISAMPNGKIATLRDVDTRSRIAIIARLRAALLAKGKYPLEQTIKAVQELLDAEKVVDPLLAQAGKTENDLDRYALNFQIFHLLDAILVGRQECTDGRTALAGISGATKYVAAGKARLEQLCTAMENHYQSLLSLGAKNSDLVAQYINTDKAALATVCQSGANPPVNCERLATVAALADTDYQSMDDAHLKFVEYAWSDNIEAAKRKGAAQ